MTDAAASAPEPVKKKRRLGCLSILLSLLAIVLLVAAIVIWMAKSEPVQLAQVNQAMAQLSPEDQLKRADDLEARFLAVMQGFDAKTGPDVKASLDPNRIVEQTLTISAIDANLWLANKFEGWLAQQRTNLPETLADPRVWIEEGQLVLSSRIKLPAVQGVVSFTFDTQMQEDGQMVLKVDKIRTGKLRLPTGIVSDQIQDQLKNAREGFTKTLSDAFEGMTFDPVFPDAGDPQRASRITAFKISDDQVEMTIRNGPKKIIEKKK